MLEFIIITLLISTFLNVLLRKFKIPTIIGYIITGIIISSPFHLKEYLGNQDLQGVAEFGIVFLMFTIGLEFSVKHLMNMKKYVFFYGGLQFIITSFVFFILLHYFFHIDTKTSIIMASGFTLSSTAIVLKILNDTKEINKQYGQKVLGILLFQDIAVIPILILITVFSQNNVHIGEILLETLISSILLIIILRFLGKYVLDIFLKKVYHTKSNEIFIGSILLLVMGSSYVSYTLGLSYSIGAFFAGMLIAETHFKHEVESKLMPFRNLLLGVFFITVGMQLDSQVILMNYAIILILLISIIIIKTLLLFVILLFTNNKITSLKTALSLFQVGEFAIIIFQISNKQELMSHALTQVLITTIIFSMILTPFVLKYMDRIIHLFIKAQSSEFINIKKLSNHIILVGYGRVGRVISEYLEKDNQEHVIIESELPSFTKAKKDGKRVLLGHITDDNIISTASLSRSSYVIIVLGFGHDNCAIVKKITQFIDPDRIIVKVNHYTEKEKLLQLNIKHIIVETEKTALMILECMDNSPIFLNDLQK